MRIDGVAWRAVGQVVLAVVTIGALGFLAASLAACSAVSGDDHTLTVACNLDDAVTFDPAVSGETLSVFVHNAAYDGLTEVKAGDLGTVAPKVADSWTHSADLKTFTFTLHPGITFASRNALTAEDVRFTFQRAKNMNRATAAVLEAMASVEALDALTVKFTLSSPQPAWPAMCADPTLGILDSKLVKQHGATDAANAETGDTAQKWLDQHSAGSGPYVLTGWKPLDQISFAANMRYWRGEPPFKYLILKHVADSATALGMLRDGKVDMVENLDPSLVDTAKAEKDLWVSTGQSLDMLYLGMTSNAQLSAALSDSRVRQAVAAAIDYDAIISGALRGFGVRAPSVIPVGIPGVDVAQTQGRDLQKARALLKEAGYEGGFTVDLTYGASATREVVAAEIKKDLTEVGITVNLVPLEQTEYLTRMRGRQLAFALGTWTPDYVDVTAWTHFFSYPDLSMAMRMWYDSPAIQEIARGIEAESDPAKRAALTVRWQTQMQQDMAFTMIYQRQVATALSKKVTAGFAYHPVYYFSPFDGLK